MTTIENRLHSYINTELDTWNFSGVIRVIKAEKILYETSRGYSNLPFGIKNTINTRFTVASIAKQFTAFAIMILYDRGQLELHAPANHYLPAGIQLPYPVTIHHLLSHTSGLHNNYNFEDDFYVGEDRAPYNQEDYYKNWILKEPICQPGESFDYNNSNYNLLAWIIETISGQTYNEFLTANIFIPLEMYHSTIDNGLTIIPNKAENYVHDYGALVQVPYTNPLFHIGAGALVTNCDDLQKWYECLRSRKILSEQTYHLFFQENRNHYCYGLERYCEEGTMKFCHGGDYLGISAITQYYFEEDICIIIISNTESLDQYRLGNAIAAILHNKIPQPSHKMEEVPLSPHELQQYTGIYLPKKIQIEEKAGKLYLVRVNQNIHIELYCVGHHQFKRRYEEQEYIHHLLADNATTPSVWGYKRISKLC